MARVKLEPNSVQGAAPSLSIQIPDDSVLLDIFECLSHDVCVDDGREKSFDFPFVTSVCFLVFLNVGAETEIVEQTNQKPSCRVGE